jgi:integrase
MAHVFGRKGVWYIRYKDVDGRWKKVSAGPKAKKSEAEYLAKQYTAQELNRQHHSPVRRTDISLANAVEEFRESFLERQPIAPNSIRREKEIAVHIGEYGKKNLLRLEEFQPQHYLDTRRTDGASPRTVRKEAQVVRKLCRWAIDRAYLFVDPSKKLVLPKLEKKHPRYFTKDELKKIYQWAKHPYRDAFQFMANTGLRSGELSNLEWRDWDEDRNTLTIRVIHGDRTQRQIGNKTRRECTIPLNDTATAILKRRKENPTHQTYIFTGRSGKKLFNELWKHLQWVMGKTEINEATVHTFRHTFASHLAIKGVSLYHIRDLLRHKSIKETEIYAHLSESATAKAVQVIAL